MMVRKTCVVSHLVKYHIKIINGGGCYKKNALLPWTDQGSEGLKWCVEECG